MAAADNSHTPLPNAINNNVNMNSLSRTKPSRLARVQFNQDHVNDRHPVENTPLAYLDLPLLLNDQLYTHE